MKNILDVPPIEAILAPFTTVGDLTVKLFDSVFPFYVEPVPPPPPPRPPKLAPVPEPPPRGAFLIGHIAGTDKPVYALPHQLDRHLLIIGGTGCGKTTLIARLFTEEILRWQ